MALNMGLRRGTEHHWSGPRLPQVEKPARQECWHCTEDRRVLVRVAIVHQGSTVGTALLCAQCIATLTPLDPDPLTVPEVA